VKCEIVKHFLIADTVEVRDEPASKALPATTVGIVSNHLP
jgi:hypothetical protein